MIPCEARDQLLREAARAQEAWYASKSLLEQLIAMRKRSEVGVARQAERRAHQRFSHAWTVILAHYVKHGCNKD